MAWIRYLFCIASLSCSVRSNTHPVQPDRIAIAVAERYERGTRLVAIDERGDRTLDLVRGADAVARDTNPAISPDGRWIVFASSRSRSLDRTSLWIAALEPEAVPTLLTDGVGIDSYPTWTLDSSAVVFASTRSGNQFDLYELTLDRRGRAIGSPRALTSTPNHEVAPTVAVDGTIVYNAVRPKADGQVESRLEARTADGATVPITVGPADTSPALSPDGTTLAFARPIARSTSVDSDLWLATSHGESARQIVDIPLTDESGPVWSRNGRFLFATSVLRGANGDAVFSAVIVVDVTAPRPVARMLVDRTGPVARLTPAIAAPELDAATLNRNPEYLPELARIAAAAIAAQQRPAATKPRPAVPTYSRP